MSDGGQLHESYQRPEKPEGSSDRAFGLVFAGFFAVLFSLGCWRGHLQLWTTRAALGLAVLFLILALAAPRWLSPLNQVWTRFGQLLHAVTSPLVLGLVFFLVVTPLGLLARLLGRDFLRLKRDPQAHSYWIDRTTRPAAAESLKQQF